MKKIFPFFLLLTFTCGHKEPTGARISQIHGDVRVQSGQATANATVGMVLTLKDAILTEKNSFADLMLPGGSVLRVRSETRLSLEDIGTHAKLKLERGGTLLGLTKLKADESFSVETPTAVASVRGTSFSVSAENKSVAVLTGSVQIEQNGRSLVLESMKEARTDRQELKSEKLSREDAQELSEILEIEGAEQLEDFDEMQKNWARFAAENQINYLPVKKIQIPSREVREK